MKYVIHADADSPLWPDPWQMLLIALCSLILCSCRAPANPRTAIHRGANVAGSLPTEAYTGPTMAAVADMPMGPPGMEAGVPMAYAPQGPWSPPGLQKPWPKDEYLRDGGDEGLPTGVGKQWEVAGLEMEDTVAHFDTLDGRTIVEPSNEVHIYSPRFGAVRQVVGLVANEERLHASNICTPEKISTPSTLQVVGNAKQNIQPGNEIGARPAVALRTKQGKDVMSSAIGPKAFQDAFKPYENLSIIRLGAYDAAEMPYLAQGSNAAIAWECTQAVQIILDRQNAVADVKYDQSMSIYTVTAPPGDPRLRVVKVASTPFAEPGDTVDFTIRFDNVGNQTIGNVTILDSLNTRLEYVPDSAQCSVDAKFYCQPNEGGSVVLRCEVTDPLEPGCGAILRFRCRVR